MPSGTGAGAVGLDELRVTELVEDEPDRRGTDTGECPLHVSAPEGLRRLLQGLFRQIRVVGRSG